MLAFFLHTKTEIFKNPSYRGDKPEKAGFCFTVENNYCTFTDTIWSSLAEANCHLQLPDRLS